jgi:hypothetical protein
LGFQGFQQGNKVGNVYANCPPDFVKIHGVIRMDELVAHASDHPPGDGWMAGPKFFRQAFDGFSKDEQLVQNRRLCLEVVEESGFVEVSCERDR